MSHLHLMGHLLVATLIVVVVPSCASNRTGTSEFGDAFMCPKCETVWVEHRDYADPYGIEYVSEEQMVCEGCRSAVATFFSTGHFDHSCSLCGNALVHCTTHH